MLGPLESDPASYGAVSQLYEKEEKKLVDEFERERIEIQRRRRLWFAIAFLAVGGLFVWSFTISEFFGGDHGADPLARIGNFLNKLNPHLEADRFLHDRKTEGSFLYWYYGWPNWFAALWETVQIAIVSSVFGAVLSVPVAVLVSRNLMPVPWVRFTVRRMLEAIRTLPDMIVALILVAAFGIGPLAGVITITMSTVGRLGKLYSEINENADMRQHEAVRASGGGWWSQLRYGLFPQVAPNYASYAMLKFEGNIGAAAALGIVGAGGIGIELSRAITYTLFADYLAILLLMTMMIFIIDMTSEWIRHKLIGMPHGKAV